MVYLLVLGVIAVVVLAWNRGAHMDDDKFDRL